VNTQGFLVALFKKEDINLFAFTPQFVLK